MVEAPLVLPPVIRELGLSEPELCSIGDFLSAENKNYGDLKRGGVCTVGTDIQPEVLYTLRTAEAEDELSTHTSFVFHISPQWGEIITIHFRENLPKLFDIVSEWDRRKAFLGALQLDFDRLARISQQEILRGVQMIVGLTHLSAKWGERHGFTTVTYSKERNQIIAHLASIGLPFQGKLPPLTTFIHQTHTFIDEFLGKLRTVQPVAE